MAHHLANNKSKGRRLQVHVAETLSVALGLTIEAVPPTKPGTKTGGAIWVEEHDCPDLRVRPSGDAGCDVAILTPKAQALVHWGGRPIHFECKNIEAFKPDAWWLGKTGLLDTVFQQMEAGARAIGAVHMAVMSRNLFKPLAVVRKEDIIFGPGTTWELDYPQPSMLLDKYFVTTWENVVQLMRIPVS